MKLPLNFKKTAFLLAKKLKGYNYAIRGTAGLVLNGIDMNVGDIDIVCDKKTALACNEIFKEFLMEKVEYRKTEKFRSYFGKFKISNIQIEIMGEWEIKNTKGEWVGPFRGEDRNEVEIDDQKVWVTTIETELKSFAAMGRWNAIWKIKRQLPLDN